MYNSKIYLKGVKIPIYVPEEKAKKIQDLFLSTTIPASQTFSVDGKSYLKDMVKGVEVVPNSPENGHIIPHWILYSPSRRSILGGPFMTDQEAKKELEYLKIGLSDEKISELDWELIQQ